MLDVLNHILTSTYPINLNFSAVFDIYEIHVFDGAVSLFASMTMILKNIYVSMTYTVNKSYRNKLLHCNNAAYQSKLPMKKWGQTD